MAGTLVVVLPSLGYFADDDDSREFGGFDRVVVIELPVSAGRCDGSNLRHNAAMTSDSPVMIWDAVRLSMLVQRRPSAPCIAHETPAVMAWLVRYMQRTLSLAALTLGGAYTNKTHAWLKVWLVNATSHV